MRSCIFCGNRAGTREDAWPLWLMRKFPKKINGVMAGEIGKKALTPWRQISPELKIKFICKGCNNGWMSRLEDQVKPILEPIINEETVLIHLQQQSILSAWAVKTTMVLEAIYHDRIWFYLPAERTSLMETLHPPARTYVWIAKCVDHNGCYSSASILKGTIDELPGQVVGYLSTISFGPFVAQALSMRLPGSPALDSSVIANVQSGSWSQAMICIWPNQMTSQKWTPVLGLSGETGLQALIERWTPNSAT
ncbi:MAG: hypothetical protein WAV05_03885 [Anaerolineales bacterium]